MNSASKENKVNVTNIILSSKPEAFGAPIHFQVFIESWGPLLNRLEWKIIYVGSAESSEFDQVLEDILIPIEEPGPKSFEVMVEPPDWTKIPSLDDLLGPSVLMVAALYNSAEFFRASYFVYNNYIEEVEHGLNEKNFDIRKVYRCILTDKPRVKITPIDWNDEENAYLADKIKVNNEEELTQIRQATEEMFNGYQNPFGLGENSFLGSKLFQGN